MNAQPWDTDSLFRELDKATKQEAIIDLHHKIFGSQVNRDPSIALEHAHIAFSMSEEFGDVDLHGQSIMNLTHAFFVNDSLAQAKSLLKQSIPFYTANEDFFMVSACYRNLAVLGEVEEQPDSSLFYLEKCLDVLEAHPDSSVLGDVFLSQGFAYRTKGFYQLSAEALYNSLRVVTALGNDNRKGYAAQNLGITLWIAEKNDEALRYMKESTNYFKTYNNERALAQSMNNIGRLYGEAGIVDSAKYYHEESLKLAIKTGQEDVQLDNSVNLFKLAQSQEDYNSVRRLLNEIVSLSKSSEINKNVALAIRLTASALLDEDKKADAQKAISGLNHEEVNYENPKEKADAYEELATIYKALDDPKRSLGYWEESKKINDSLFTLKKAQQVEELNLIYETEKKDAEIQLLAKNVELEQTKKRSLIGGLILLFLAAGSTILALVQRSRKNKQIHQQEKQLEIQKRETAEKELEFKKKELTAKALQLASKNEFLQKLEEQVSDLKSSVDSTVSQTSQRISRMIMMDGQEDEEWDQFTKEFSSVHSGYLDRLRGQFGSFSTSETRLISLMKMNLSSKDIANILRISADGVKKARYRLRKKMELDSDVDIQQYLINY